MKPGRKAIKKLLLRAILVCMALFFTSCNTTLTGTIAVKGNMPFSYLALSTEQGEFEIQKGELHDLLWNQHQGATVTLKVTILRAPEGPLPGQIEVLKIVK